MPLRTQKTIVVHTLQRLLDAYRARLMNLIAMAPLNLGSAVNLCEGADEEAAVVQEPASLVCQGLLRARARSTARKASFVLIRSGTR